MDVPKINSDLWNGHVASGESCRRGRASEVVKSFDSAGALWQKIASSRSSSRSDFFARDF